jgi:hypothetical protein
MGREKENGKIEILKERKEGSKEGRKAGRKEVGKAGR